MALTASGLKRLKQGFHTDGAGLQAFKGKDSGLSWIWITALPPVGGGAPKQTRLTIGHHPEMGLDDARSRVMELKKLRKQGVDVREVLNAGGKKEEDDSTVGFVFSPSTTLTQAADFAQAQLKQQYHDEGRDSKYPDVWRAGLKNYLEPKLGPKRLVDITFSDLVAVFRQPVEMPDGNTETFWRGRPELASKTLKTLRGLFTREDMARVLPATHILPTTGLSKNLGSQGHQERHQPSLQVHEAQIFWQDLKQLNRITSDCLQVIALTGCRSKEIRMLTWEMVELDDDEVPKIAIPAPNTKSGKVNRVVLSQEAIDILRKQESDSEYVFAHPNGKPLSENAFTKLLQGLGYKDEDGRRIVVHGMRSTLKRWGKQCLPMEHQLIIESMLSHSTGGRVYEAYNRGEIAERQYKAVTELWSDFLNARVSYEELRERTAARLEL